MTPTASRAGEACVPPPGLSQVLIRLAEDWPGSRISVAQLMAALGDRGLLGLLMILAVANVIPNPPGTSSLLGLPMLYLSWQMMRGGQPWLPQLLAARSFDIGHFRILISRAMPHLHRVERLLKPRMSRLSGPRGLPTVGCCCLFLSIILVLPIPLGNVLPAAAIAVIALGALQRDGMWIIGGMIFGALSTFLMAGTIILLIRALLRLIELGL